MWGTLDDRERDARRALLDLMAGGNPADVPAVAAALGCGRAEARQLLDGLVAKGFVVRDVTNGGITAAYPLSARPTRHRMTLADGRIVYALCAMDALGASALFAVPAAIRSRCPHCKRRIHLEVQDGDVRRKDPSTTVVWYSRADLLEERIEGLDLSAEH